MSLFVRTLIHKHESNEVCTPDGKNNFKYLYFRTLLLSKIRIVTGETKEN